MCFSLPGRSQSPAHMFLIILTLTWLKRHSEEICERILKRHVILLFIFPFSYWINNLKQSRKSVQFCHPVMSNSLQPHEPQDTRPPCPSPTPRVYPNSCPLSQWCYRTISFYIVPFSSCPQSSNESALHIIWPKYWSFSFDINPSNEHSGLISLRMD